MAADAFPLFGVLGFRRVRGGAQTGSIQAVRNGKSTTVVVSQEMTFLSLKGASISVSSHRGDDDHAYTRIRSWAPFNPYLASQRGRIAAATWDGSLPAVLEDLEWADFAIAVDNQKTPFEIAELEEELWVAVGRVQGTIVSIDSRGVPLREVRLERLTDDRIPPPPRPDLGVNRSEAVDALDRRFEMIPFHRIRRWGDYWALLSVERDHVDELVRERHLSLQDAKTLHQYWEDRLGAQLANTFDRPDSSPMMGMNPPRIAGRRRFLFQLWFNTLGPRSKDMVWQSLRQSPKAHVPDSLATLTAADESASRRR